MMLLQLNDDAASVNDDIASLNEDTASRLDDVDDDDERSQDGEVELDNESPSDWSR